METRKQHFNSAVSDAIVHLRGRAQTLAPYGWTGEKAEWIVVVCLHNGAFTRAQCARFLEAHPEQVRRVFHAQIAQDLATEETVAGIRGIGRVCRIFSRRIYRALGAKHIRRDASPSVLMRHLLSLDYVIEHPGLPWLATESEKVAAFEALGIERGLLPVRVYRGAAGTTRRYFPLKLPVALDAERAVFVYADPGHDTATALRYLGAAHRGLWHVLQRRGLSVEVVVAGRTSSELERARRVMRGWARPSGHAEPDPEVRKELDRIERAILADAVLNWAAKSKDEHRHLLLDANPLRGLRRPRRRTPPGSSFPTTSTWRCSMCPNGSTGGSSSPSYSRTRPDTASAPSASFGGPTLNSRAGPSCGAPSTRRPGSNTRRR